MKFETVRYTRRKPAEEYGFEELEMLATIEEGDDAQACALEVRTSVNDVLKGIAKSPVKGAAVEGAKATEAQELPPKPEKRKTRGRPRKEETEGEVVESAEETATTEEAAPDNVEEAVEIVEKPKAAAKKFVPQATPYDRNDAIHKKLFAKILTDEFPDWKSTPGRAKDASITLEGKPFLGADGEPLESFIELLREEM